MTRAPRPTPVSAASAEARSPSGGSAEVPAPTDVGFRWGQCGVSDRGIARLDKRQQRVAQARVARCGWLVRLPCASGAQPSASHGSRPVCPAVFPSPVRRRAEGSVPLLICSVTLWPGATTGVTAAAPQPPPLLSEARPASAGVRAPRGRPSVRQWACPPATGAPNPSSDPVHALGGRSA